jgi:hypothetical protein
MERGFYSLDDDEAQQDAAIEAAEAPPPVVPAQDITIIAEASEVLPAGTAVKFDGGKAPVYQGFLNRFPRAILSVAFVSEYGFRKYGSYDGWEKVPDGLNRYTDAKNRHALLQSIEGAYDEGDSGLAHAAQEAWGAMARLEMLLREKKIEMRRGNEIKDGKPVLGTARVA